MKKRINFEFAMGGLKDRFHRLGYRADVERLLGEIDLVVHCARQEPFGRVLLEAAAAERPIIATTVGGTQEMLVHGESAILVAPDEPEAMAEAMVRLHGDAEYPPDWPPPPENGWDPIFDRPSGARAGEVWRKTIG